MCKAVEHLTINVHEMKSKFCYFSSVWLHSGTIFIYKSRYVSNVFKKNDCYYIFVLCTVEDNDTIQLSFL